MSLGTRWPSEYYRQRRLDVYRWPAMPVRVLGQTKTLSVLEKRFSERENGSVRQKCCRKGTDLSKTQKHAIARDIEIPCFSTLD